MALATILEQLLRVQAAAGETRVQLAKMTGLPGAERIAQEIVNLEIELASMIARSLGAQPMAVGGLVTQPTFALLGEAGPEMVIPVKKKKRKVSKYQKQWGKELKKIKTTSRLKDGSYRKGWNQAKEFSKAHKMTKKAMKN